MNRTFLQVDIIVFLNRVLQKFLTHKSDKDYTAKYKRRAFETQRIYHAGYTEDDSTTFDRFIVKGILL